MCAATEAAVRAFQLARGLHADGVCDEHTWTALVEASWRFGDRALYLRSPNLRGDDVGELQSSLARLGFDCGRIDGIFGPRTARALESFQSNCGITVDGLCGTETVRVILRVSSQTGDGPGVSAVRERERLRVGFGSVANCRVVLGQFGGMSPLTRGLARELRLRGATVMTLDEPDAVAQALAANQFSAHVYIGFESHAEPAAVASFYKVPTFESLGGRTLAESIAGELSAATEIRLAVEGMRLPVLRETRMTAVLLTLGPVRTMVDASPMLADAVLRGVDQWISRST